MGSVDHGTQNQTYNFYEELSGEEFNKRNIDIRPRGIYKGGYLTRVSDSVITLSPFTVEIGDDDVQVCVKTSATATINNTTLDSGTISSATPYIILRWAYAESSANYLEVHAVNQAAINAIALTNDIVVGKCNFSGSTLVDFDYTDRTFLSIQNLFLKVETSSGLYVQLRAGRIHTSSGYIIVPEEKVGLFTPPVTLSRVDLVYINTDGTVGIDTTGAEAASPSAPSYAGRMVVAEITLSPGDVSIGASKIRDVRSFGTQFVGSGLQLRTGTLITYDFTQADLTQDGAWHDLDLSSIIPVGTKAVTLNIGLLTTTRAPAETLSFRKKGVTDVFNVGNLSNTQQNVGQFGEMVIGVDADRKVQYQATFTFGAIDTIHIVVKNWYL